MATAATFRAAPKRSSFICGERSGPSSSCEPKNPRWDNMFGELVTFKSLTNFLISLNLLGENTGGESEDYY